MEGNCISQRDRIQERLKRLEEGSLLPKQEGWQSEEGSFDLSGKTAVGS